MPKKYKKYISIVLVLLLLCSFYQLGIPLLQLMALGVVFISIVLLKNPIREGSDKLVNEKLVFLNKTPGWLKKVIVFLIFLLIFMALKQAIFFGFKSMGVDLKEMMMKSINSEFVFQPNDSLVNHQEKAIVDYLLTQEQFAWQTKENSKNICSIENLGDNSLFPFYIWVYCSEYDIEEGRLERLSGCSLPVKIDYPNELSFYDLSKFSYEMPRDGSLYSADVKRIFPESVQQLIFDFDSKSIIEKNKKEAENIFLQ